MKNGMASRAQRAVEGNPSSFSLFGNIASRMLGLRERRITLLDRRRSSPPSSISISTPSSISITTCCPARGNCAMRSSCFWNFGVLLART